MTVFGRLAPDDRRHGTVSGYQNFDCRCDACRVAHREWHREYVYRTGRRRPMAQYLAELRARHPIKHGTENGYRRCRKRDEGACQECRDAAAARRRSRARLAPDPRTVANRAKYAAEERAHAWRLEELRRVRSDADGQLRMLFEEQEREDRFDRAGLPYGELSLDAPLPSGDTFYDVTAVGVRLARAYEGDDWTDRVHEKVDRARQIDLWAEEA